MEKQKNIQNMIDFLVCPGFSVESGKISQVNEAAERLFLAPGMEMNSLLVTGQEEYASLTSGCLYLTLTVAGEPRGAVITVLEDCQLVLVDQDQELRELQVLALAAQELRTPLSNIMISAERVVPAEDASRQYQGKMNRGLNQMLRLVGNMSDALRYAKGWQPETRNIPAILAELCEKAQVLCAEKDITLSYQVHPGKSTLW